MQHGILYITYRRKQNNICRNVFMFAITFNAFTMGSVEFNSLRISHYNSVSFYRTSDLCDIRDNVVTFMPLKSLSWCLNKSSTVNLTFYYRVRFCIFHNRCRLDMDRTANTTYVNGFVFKG